MSKRRWSRKHDHCINCGTKEIKHAAHGLCRHCYYVSRPPPEPKPIKSKYRRGEAWSMNYKSCRRCGTKTRKHEANGLCMRCRSNMRAVLRRKSKYGQEGWSSNYKACIECGTTSIKHNAKGLCQSCYGYNKRRS